MPRPRKKQLNSQSIKDWRKVKGPWRNVKRLAQKWRKRTTRQWWGYKRRLKAGSKCSLNGYKGWVLNKRTKTTNRKNQKTHTQLKAGRGQDWRQLAARSPMYIWGVGKATCESLTLAWPCLPVFEVDISTILQGRPLSTTKPFLRNAEHCIGKVAEAPASPVSKSKSSAILRGFDSN